MIKFEQTLHVFVLFRLVEVLTLGVGSALDGLVEVHGGSLRDGVLTGRLAMRFHAGGEVGQHPEKRKVRLCDFLQTC